MAGEPANGLSKPRRSRVLVWTVLLVMIAGVIGLIAVCATCADKLKDVMKAYGELNERFPGYTATFRANGGFGRPLHINVTMHRTDPLQEGPSDLKKTAEEVALFFVEKNLLEDKIADVTVTFTWRTNDPSRLQSETFLIVPEDLSDVEVDTASAMNDAI
jgi:hypothetical protein